MTVSTTELFLCGPQASLPSTNEINKLRQSLLARPKLCESLTALLKELPGLLKQIIHFDPTLKQTPVATSFDILVEWLNSGISALPAEPLPNVSAIPFVVLLQLSMFLQHLDKSKVGVSYISTLQSLQKYGVQGFCTGFLTATAIAFSVNEDQLIRHTAISLRLATCIGAYVDCNATYNDPPNPVVAFSVRWRESDFSKDRMQLTLSEFPHVGHYDLYWVP
jgi:hypothetical protein